MCSQGKPLPQKYTLILKVFGDPSRGVFNGDWLDQLGLTGPEWLLAVQTSGLRKPGEICTAPSKRVELFDGLRRKM